MKNEIKNKNFIEGKRCTKKAKLKMHIGPLLPKWRPRLNFQHTMFWLLTNIRERWERFWRAIDLRFLAGITEGRIISVGMILGPIPEVPTDDVIKYIKKAPENTKKLINGKVMNVYSIFCWGYPWEANSWCSSNVTRIVSREDAMVIGAHSY